MNYYFENHVQIHKHSPLNSLFLSDKLDNTSPNQKHFNINTQHSIISKVNIIHPNPLLNNNNNNTTNSHYTHPKQLHTKPKTYNVETDSDTNTEDDNTSFITNKNNIKNNIISLLKDKIFSPGNYQEQDELLLMNNNYNNINDSVFNISISNSQINNNNNSSTRTPFNVTSLSPLRNISPSHHRKTLILDLDETLVHSTFHPIYRVPDIQLNIQFNNHNHLVYVFKRPYVDNFLYQMSKTFNIVIFTASIPEYANPLLDKLDTYNVISKRFFRGDCTVKNGLYVKELKKVGHNLEDMIIIDNNPISYSLNKENGFPIRTWHYDKNDIELNKIIPYLEYLSKVDDVRCVLNKVNIGGCIDEVYFDLLLGREDNKCVGCNKGMNEYTKKESYMNGNKKKIKSDSNSNQSMMVLNRCKSSSSFYQRNDNNNEHVKRVNKLKEEILNSINLIEHKGNQYFHNDISVRDINTNNIIKSCLKYFNNNNNNKNNDTNIKHYHHHLRRTNSSMCIMIRPNSSIKNNNDNNNNTHSIVNKPNYINFSHLSHTSNTNESYCSYNNNKDNHYNYQTPIHNSFITNNKSCNTSSQRRNIFKTPSMTSLPTFDNDIHPTYLKYKPRYASGIKNK